MNKQINCKRKEDARKVQRRCVAASFILFLVSLFSIFLVVCDDDKLTWSIYDDSIEKKCKRACAQINNNKIVFKLTCLRENDARKKKNKKQFDDLCRFLFITCSDDVLHPSASETIRSYGCTKEIQKKTKWKRRKTRVYNFDERSSSSNVDFVHTYYVFITVYVYLHGTISSVRRRFCSQY